MNQMILYTLTVLYINSSWANIGRHEHDGKSSLLTHALRVGTDSHGTILYLCQSNLFNSVHPGKTWAGYNRCNVPYEGKEYIVDEFIIPNKRVFGHFSWSQVMQKAIVIGKNANGMPLFLCQSYFQGMIQPGKTWEGYNHCNISYAGREIITDNYRVLVNGSRGKAQIHPLSPSPGNNIHNNYK